MHQPTHIWGVQVVQGAAVAVGLRRGADAAFEIESAYVEPNDGTSVAVHVAALLLARTGLRGQPAVVALPDASECLLTAPMPSGDADRSGPELERELAKLTPFEPGHEELRHVRVAHDAGAEVHLVAAISKSAYSAAVHAFQHRVPAPALAFGGAATIRGARALGLCPDPCVLVEVEPHATIAYVVDGTQIRRRAVPVGSEDVARDPALADRLAQALLQIAAPAAAAGGGAPGAPRDAPFVLVGPGAASPRVRQALAAKLGPRLAGGHVVDARVRSAPGARLHHASLPTLAGAVGAALEGFAPEHERLLLRPLPADLHPPRGPRLSRRAVAVVALVCLAFAGLQVWVRLGGDDTSRASKRVAGEVRRPAETEPESADGVRPARPEPSPRATPPASAAAASRPTVAPLTAGCVRVSWPAGRAGRVLRRSGAERDAWDIVATLDAAAGSLDDEVPGATRLYGWRVDDGDVAFARVDVPVTVEFLGPNERGGGRFRLRRQWRGAERTEVVDAAPGESIRGSFTADGSTAAVALDPGLRLEAVRVRAEVRPEEARVPLFLPDGRVERGADGGPLTKIRTVPRERSVVEADGVDESGAHRTWTSAGG